MATKIKLMRLGKMRAPYYRIVVADARTKRDGRSIETIGKYHPKEDPSFIELNSERAQYWLGVGAQPTEAVAAILRVTGDWQQFTGEPAPPPMLVKAPKADKRALFEAASKQATEEPASDATTPKKRVARPAKAVADNAAAGTPTAGPTADQAAASAAEKGTTLLEQRVAAGDPAAIATTPAASPAGADPAGAAPADAGPADASPTSAAPAGAAPADASPAGAAPAGATPTDAASDAAGPAAEPAPAEG